MAKNKQKDYIWEFTERFALGINAQAKEASLCIPYESEDLEELEPRARSITSKLQQSFPSPIQLSKIFFHFMMPPSSGATNQSNPQKLLVESIIKNVYNQATVTDKDLFDDLNKELINLCRQAKKQSRSTPVTVDPYYDIRKILGHPVRCEWLLRLSTTALLENDVFKGLLDTKNHHQPDLIHSFRFLACTVNGAALAVAIQRRIKEISGVNIPVDIIERFGPDALPRYEHLSSTHPFQGQYWYIGDVLVLGTEIKLAAAYAQTKNSKLQNGFVLGAFPNPKFQYDSVGKLSLLKQSRISIWSLNLLHDMKVSIK